MAEQAPGVQTRGPVRLGGRAAAAPVRTGWDDVTTAPGAAGHWTHTQTTPQSVVTITHALGYRPAGVALFSLDYGITYRGYAVQHLDENTLRISMDVPTAFVAVLS